MPHKCCWERHRHYAFCCEWHIQSHGGIALQPLYSVGCDATLVAAELRCRDPFTCHTAFVNAYEKRDATINCQDELTVSKMGSWFYRKSKKLTRDPHVQGICKRRQSRRVEKNHEITKHSQFHVSHLDLFARAQVLQCSSLEIASQLQPEFLP